MIKISRDIAREFNMLFLVGTNRDNICIIQQYIRRHQYWICVQSHINPRINIRARCHVFFNRRLVRMGAIH